MAKRMEARVDALKPKVRFHWEKSCLKKKTAEGEASKVVYKPSLNRGTTLGTDEVIDEFIKAEDLSIPASTLKIYLKGILSSMVENVLIDGRSRRIDDFFTVRLDMKGTAERQDEPYNPAKHKFTINFQKARRFSEKSKNHALMVIGKPVCEIPPSRSIIKNAHSQGAKLGEVYLGRQIILEGNYLSPCPFAQVALKVNYPVASMMYNCEIIETSPDRIVVESPKHFEKKYMRDSATGLMGEVVLYLNDSKHPHRQSAHGSRFKVKFVCPPKGKG
ncbi:MAG: hypothetical protein MJY78_11625 [Fibrobacter sp.]|nr:hypothetical protein [Fibrobacter sp.]